MSRADDFSAIERGMVAVGGLGVAPITTSKVLGEHETGVILIDASAGAMTITLPPAKKPMDVRVQRVDNGGNRLVIQAAGGELIRFHTHLRVAGYPFFVLMGAGDFWHLRSDGVGGWMLLDRQDATALGRPVFESTTVISPGGWGLANGALMSRAEWPWLWDYAQQSGMLVTDAQRVGMEGAWTSGDGASNLRTPELRGEFLRGLADGRGVDASRRAGSMQKGTRFAFGSGTNNAGALGTWWSDNLYIMSDAEDFVQDTPPHNGGAIYPAGTIYQSNTSAMLMFEYRSRPRNIGLPVRIKLI